MTDTAKGVSVVLGAALLAYIGLGSDLLASGNTDVEMAVAAELRDPSSAEFRNIRTGPDASCGEVNGKNGFGAYSRFRRFVVKNGIVLFEAEQPLVPDTEQQAEYFRDQARFARFSRECYG